MRVLCECGSWTCHLRAELTPAENRERGELVLIVDGCETGPEAGDVLVRDGDGYRLYRDRKPKGSGEVA